eukprot:symbB.v1.2.016177.t1/scaffold1227.1/size245474/4
MPKSASLDSAASQLIPDLQQRLKKELNITSSLEKVGTNGSTIKLSMTISGYEMYQELPKEIAADEALKKSMSSLSEELAGVNVNVEEVYGELLTKWKDFLEGRWMKLIPPIFEKVLSKEQVAANVSVVTAPAESEVVKKNSTINSTVSSLPKVEVFLRVELEKRLPLAKKINPNIDPEEVEALNQTLYLALVRPRIQEEVAKAVREKLGDAFSFTITPEGHALRKVNATMAGSARKLLSTLDLLKKRGVAGLENVTATVRASLRAHSLDKLLGGFTTRIGDLLEAQVQSVEGSSYRWLQGMAPYGICCRSERSSKDGNVKTDEVFWIEAEVTKGGKDTHNGLCPDIREATNPPCVAFWILKKAGSPIAGRDDEVCRELEQPVADGDQDSGKRGRDSAGIRMSGPEFSTPASWQGVGQNERMRTPARDEQGLGNGQKSSGTMPQETPEASGVKTEGPHPAAEEVTDAFQRALEREMVEKLQEDNRKLQRELQDLKMQRDLENYSGLESSWSDVSSRPQPPPPEEENEPQRFTPNGTKVPKGPPPNFDERVPSWPLGPYEQSAVDCVWKQLGPTAVSVGEAARLHDGRVGHGARSRHVRSHHDCGPGHGARSRQEPEHRGCRDGGGAERSRHGVAEGEVGEQSTQTMSDVLTSVQARAFWLERELESLKGALNDQRQNTLTSEYWRKPVHRYEGQVGGDREQAPLGRAELRFGGELGDGRGQAPLGRAELGFGGELGAGLGRAPLSRAEFQGGREQVPLSRANRGECQGDRAFASQQPAGLGEDLRGEVGGGNYHGSRLLRQQLHGVHQGDPEGWIGSGGGKRGEQRSPDGLRSTNPTLPKLPALNSKTASVDMSDWLIEVQPIIGDLSNLATHWWSETLKLTMDQYSRWLEASPLERLRLLPPRPDLGEWLGNPTAVQRLEQRVTTLLMTTLPDELKNDVIANRTLWPAAILFRVLRSFQPGGWSERADLLKALTGTSTATSPAMAASQLRMWKRQRLRATELGASLPDLMIQVQAIEKIALKVLNGNPQSMFRVSSFRMESNVDERPSETSILQFHELLLAEMDMLATGSIAGTMENATVKAMAPGGAPNQDKSLGQDKNFNKSFPCKFWGTPSGCRHGKRCSFLHPNLVDQSSRCFVCSSTEHRKSECPYREVQQSMEGSSASTGGSGTKGGKSGKGGGKSTQNKGGESKSNKEVDSKVKVAAMDGGDKPASSTTPTISQEQGKSGEKAVGQSAGESMVQPQAVTPHPPPTTGETELVNEVTSLLRSLRAEASIKVCGLKKVHPGDKQSVLLDGGATHCLRTCKDHQEWIKARDIEVSLAEGTRTMKQCPSTKTLLTKEKVQPIIPLSSVTLLGYQIQWSEQGCRISHPGRPDLPVQLVQGCPTVEFDVGMKLFKEVEDLQKEQCWIRAVLAGDEKDESDPRFRKLRELFDQVPLQLLGRVPGKKNWDPSAIPINRRRRRQILRAKTLIFNVFSGPDEGSWKRLEKNGVVVVCLDLLLNCNLLDNNVAGWIEEVIQTRGVDLWLAGPPCRTISLLRHKSPGPEPLRGGLPEHRFGLPGLSPTQQQRTDDDTVLWLRNLWWMWLNKEYRPSARNFLEQPRDPNQWYQKPKEDCQVYPSFLRWEETKKVIAALGLKENHVEQGALGHKTVKPSTFLSDLEEIRALDGLVVKDKSNMDTTWPLELEERLQFSKSLASWAPGLKEILFKVVTRIASGSEPSMRKLTSEELAEIQRWEAHVRQGHTPYRRDCAVCAEACGRDRQHRRQPTGEAFTMSLDISGPYETGIDQSVIKPRYYLTSVVTIPRVDGNPLVEGLRELGAKNTSEEADRCIAPGTAEEASWDGVNGQQEVKRLQTTSNHETPRIAVVQARAEEERGGQQPGEPLGRHHHEGGHDEDPELFRESDEQRAELTQAEVQEMDKLNLEWAQLIKNRPKVEVVHLAQTIPIASRRPRDVLEAVSLMYCRMKSLRVPILRIHTDRAKEFIGKEFKSWCLSSSSFSPQAPIADSFGLVNPDEVLGLCEPGVCHDVPDGGLEVAEDIFGLEAEEQPLEIVQEVDIQLHDASEGQLPATIPPKRRLHQKTRPALLSSTTSPTLRRMALRVGGESLREELQMMDQWMTLQHEMLSQLVQELLTDVEHGIPGSETTLQHVKKEVGHLEASLRKASAEESDATYQELEEVLQTRTVPIQEVRQDMAAWYQPFKEEYDTLCSTVIQPMTPEETRKTIAEAAQVERIPSKIVPTIKPPHKKRGRIVACGNYASAPEGEVSAGVETICLRTLLRKAAHMQWTISTIDVKKAFLNAPRIEKSGNVTIIDPPGVLVSMGVVPSTESWRVTGAIYGLIQSPHDWGLHRDATFRELSWTCEGEQLRLIETPERHLWKITHEASGQERGFLCSYVDDLLVTGKESVVKSTIEQIRSKWACSDPEQVNQHQNTRFCGYELRWDGESLLLTQPSYTQDLVNKYGVTAREKDPCPKIVAGEDEVYDAETLRRAQQITGELLWIQTRTRPELSYVVGAMSRWLHRRPAYVIELGQHALRYLAGSVDFAIKYDRCNGQEWNLEEGYQTPASMHQVEVLVDSSFSLEHEQYRSVTGVILSQGRAPLSWTSGRQAFIASSTAEAEILGYSEAQQQAESLNYLLKIFGYDVSFHIYGDCKSLETPKMPFGQLYLQTTSFLENAIGCLKQCRMS